MAMVHVTSGANGKDLEVKDLEVYKKLGSRMLNEGSTAEHSTQIIKREELVGLMFPKEKK